LAGQGYGIDIGVTARTSPKLTVGLTITNAVSSMTWRDLIQVHGTIQGDLAASDDGGPVFPEDPDDFSEYEETQVASLTRKLPMEVRTGASYQLSPKILIAADVAKTFSEHGSDRPLSLHVGAEIKPFAEAMIGRRLAFR